MDVRGEHKNKLRGKEEHNDSKIPPEPKGGDFVTCWIDRLRFIDSHLVKLQSIIDVVHYLNNDLAAANIPCEEHYYAYR